MLCRWGARGIPDCSYMIDSPYPFPSSSAKVPSSNSSVLLGPHVASRTRLPLADLPLSPSSTTVARGSVLLSTPKTVPVVVGPLGALPPLDDGADYDSVSAPPIALRRLLKDEGWTWAVGSGLVNYYYIPPNRKSHRDSNAIEGFDYFTSESKVLDFLETRWRTHFFSYPAPGDMDDALFYTMDSKHGGVKRPYKQIVDDGPYGS